VSEISQVPALRVADRGHVGEQSPDHRVEQARVPADVGVQRHRGDADLLGDRPRRHRLEAAFIGESQRRVQDLFSLGSRRSSDHSGLR
jgi:hypothetical protein